MESLPQACKYNRHQCLRQTGTPTSLGDSIAWSQSLLFRQSKWNHYSVQKPTKYLWQFRRNTRTCCQIQVKNPYLWARPARLCTALPAVSLLWGTPLVVLRPEHARLGLRFLPVCIVSKHTECSAISPKLGDPPNISSHIAHHTARLYRQGTSAADWSIPT